MNCLRLIYRYILAVLVIIISVIGHVQSQISYGGLPYGTQRIMKAKATLDIPIIDLRVNTDSINLLKVMGKEKLSKELEIGLMVNMNISPKNSGLWDTLDNGSKIWRIGIRSTGAEGMAVFFNSFHLEKGVNLFIYNNDLTMVIGAFTQENNNSSGVLPTSPIEGDLMYIELQLAKYKKDYGSLNIGMVAHVYAAIFSNQKLIKDNRFDRSGDCNIDINCFSENGQMQQLKYSVARFTYPDGGYYYYCTGTLMNNTQQNGTPYFLTANHCLSNSFSSQNAVFFFDYESPYCSGPDGYTNKTIAGAELVATNPNLDFSLVELFDSVPVNYHPYYAGWSIREDNIDHTFTIHHPQGDVKKATVDNETPTTRSYPDDYLHNTHWYIDVWDQGVTEPGSSGCPLFNQFGQVIGDLSGGNSRCGYPYEDYYQKLSASWNTFSPASQRLDVWLSPGTSAINEINGFDPYSQYKNTCDTLSNSEGSSKELLKYAGDGYWSGHNTGGYTQFAEKYSINQAAKLHGFYVNVAKAFESSMGSTVTFLAWDGSYEPNTVLASKAVPINNFLENTVNYVEFDQLIDVPQNFFVGFEINYFYDDTFAVYQEENTTHNTFELGNGSSWNDFNDIYTENKPSTLCLMPVICGASIDTFDLPDVETGSLFPNPTTGKVFFYYNDNTIKAIVLKVYDLSGRTVYVSEKTMVTGYFEADLSQLGYGIYIAQVIENDRVKNTAKLVIVNPNK